MPDDFSPSLDNLARRQSGTQQWQTAIEQQRQRDLVRPSMGEQLGDVVNRIIAGNPIMQMAQLYRDLSEGRVDVTSPEAAGRSLWSAMGMAGAGMPYAQRGALGMSGGKITAYHGSPHDFEKFSSEKIGTGEGAQSYGHGLYFAENEGTAKTYRRNIFLNSFEQRAADFLKDAGGNRQQAIAALHHQAATMNALSQKHGTPVWGQTARLYEGAATLLRDGWEPPAPGHMYQVDINADPEHFLDWDKPISEQPYVAAKLAEAGLLPGDLSYLEQMTAQHGPDSWYAHQLNFNRNRMKQTGREIHDIADLSSREKSGADVLREAGIPGIRYLDQFSRNSERRRISDLISQLESGLQRETGAERARTQAIIQEEKARLAALPIEKDTSNYVVFNDQLVDIIKKYGIAGLIAAGAYSHQDSGQ